MNPARRVAYRFFNHTKIPAVRLPFAAPGRRGCFLLLHLLRLRLLRFFLGRGLFSGFTRRLCGSLGLFLGLLRCGCLSGVCRVLHRLCAGGHSLLHALS